MAENLDWLYDYLLQFLKSPGWRVPILNFIDQYCYQFEDSADNKLIYTEIHNVTFTQKFKELIDGLLENLCITIGITQQQFLKVCEKGISNPSHKRVFEQMLACDNFVSFKKLMLKRNKDIEAEALKNNESKRTVPKGNEDAEMELARTMSIQAAEEQKKMEEKYNEELRLAMKLSEEDFQAHLRALKEIEEADQRKQDIFKQAEEREQAKLNALKEEADKVLKQKIEEEQRLVAIREEEARIKKLIEDRKLEEKRKSEVEISAELREKELQIQIKAAEAERMLKEAESKRLQNEQFELMKKIQDAEEKRKAEEQALVEKERKKEEKRLEKERIRLMEEQKIKELAAQQRLSIVEEEKRIELEKQRLKEEAKRIEEERMRMEIEKEEKLKRKIEKQRIKDEEKRKAEEDKLRSLEAEERKRIEEETERIQRLQKENKKLEEIMTLKKEKAKKRVKKAPKQEEEVKVELGPESSLGVKHYEKELTFDESVENEVRRVQEGVIRQQENEVAAKVKSSLPPIHGKMGLMTGLTQSADTFVSSPEKTGPETLAEREARLKAQRDKLLEAKRKQRDDAFKEYINDGGADLGKKATPAVSNEELEKRKQVLMKIKTYSEENEH